jgi:hypothetical protein
MLPSCRIAVLACLLAAGTACGQMTLSCTQPCGDGSFRLQVTGCGAFAQIYNLMSFTPYSPTGGGPIFGLGLNGSAMVYQQLLMPVGAAPFHVTADAAGSYAWQFCLPPGVPVVVINADIVTVKWSLTAYGGRSNVVNLTVRL